MKLIGFDQSTLTLAQKGLLLVALTLCFELAFILVLAYMLQQAERETVNEARSKIKVAEVDRLHALLLQAASAASIYILSKSRPAEEELDNTYRKMSKQLDVLKGISTNSPKQRKAIAQLDSIHAEFAEIMSDTKAAMRDEGRQLAYIRSADLPQEIGRMSRETGMALEEFVSGDRQLTQAASGLGARSRSMVKAALFTGVLLNIFLFVWLANYFNKGTARRLAIIVDNAKRITRCKGLNEPLTGKDELADLDRVFHEMARRLDEMEALKREFVAMVSHDLRSPLTSLQIYLKLLRDGEYGSLSEKGFERTTAQERGVKRLISLINDLLDIEKLESGRMEIHTHSFPVVDLLSNSIAAVQDLADRKDITLALADCNMKTDITADEQRLTQVLVNLLANAIQHSPTGGIVDLSAEEEDGTFLFKVKDQGPGIPADQTEFVFERFRQITTGPHKKEGGSGLGLPISKLIVEMHGGTISVESVLGQGSTFWFRIPKKAVTECR